jgi:muramoyltetrapeptide carboxypeptidase LdcA involved in peptidoglycan recycling
MAYLDVLFGCLIFFSDKDLHSHDIRFSTIEEAMSNEAVTFLGSEIGGLEAYQLLYFPIYCQF